MSITPRVALSAPSQPAPSQPAPSQPAPSETAAAAAAARGQRSAPSASFKLLAQNKAAAGDPPGPAKPASDRSKRGAKPDDTPPPAQVKKARDLWYRGVEAFRKGDYEEARVAFAECYALMPKSDVLRNLSISEIQSGHYVSAARHLRQLLAAGELPGKVREEATTRLAQAEAQIGQLGISVDLAGADISIDGTTIGRAPLEGSWYIEPGLHEVSVSKPGYPVDKRQIFALAGVAIPVEVSLESLKREQAADEQAARLMGTSEGQAPVSPYGADGLSTASTVALVTTGTVAAASLAAGIYFSVLARDHDSEAERLANRLPDDGCGGASSPFLDRCALLRNEREDSIADRQRSIIGFIGFGVASAATLGYALWLALDGADGESPATAMQIEPSLSIAPGRASLSVQAQF